MNQDLLYIKKLESLRADHRDIDDKLNNGGLDEFSYKRLQKVKLFLRDEIRRLELVLYPDITA